MKAHPNSNNLFGLTTVIVLLVSIDAMDSIMVGTAMPTILASLGGIGWYGWTVGAFGLASFAAIPIFGHLTSRWGLRNVIFIALGLFLLGSVAAALAPKMKLLVGARVLQGLGMGGITALPFAIISTQYPSQHRAKPLGLISPVFVVCGLLAPFLASQLLERATWPWVFWVNIPLVLIIGFLVFRMLPPTSPAATEGASAKMNLLGPILFSVLAGFSLKAFTSVWPVNLIQWGVAVTALIVFIWHERRHPNPFIPSDAFSLAKPLGAIFLAVILVRACFGAARIYVPLLLEGVWGLNALAAGFSLTLASLTWSGGGFFVAAKRATRTPLAKWGTLLIVTSLVLLLAVLWTQSEVLFAYGLWALVGLGMGVATSIYGAAAMQLAEDYPRGVTGSTLQLGTALGSALGPAAANTIAQLGFSKGFDPKLLDEGALTGASLRSLLLGASLAQGLAIVLALASILMAWRFFRSQRPAGEMGGDLG